MQALEGLRNRSGWQISRDDDLKVAYQHIAGEHLFVFRGCAEGLQGRQTD